VKNVESVSDFSPNRIEKLRTSFHRLRLAGLRKDGRRSEWLEARREIRNHFCCEVAFASSVSQDVGLSILQTAEKLAYVVEGRAACDPPRRA